MDACLNIKMNNSNKNITFDHFVYYTYELIENSNYLNILEINNDATTCASGSKVIKEVYIIDKNSKQVINQDKIKESIDNYDNVIEDLLKFIDTQTEDEQIYNYAKNQIDNNNYFVYYGQNNNIIFTFINMTGSYNEKYGYDGINFSKIEL